MQFTVPIFNPCYTVLNVAEDWGITPTTQNLDVVLQQKYRVAGLRVFYDCPNVHSYDPEVAKIDAKDFDFVILSDAEFHRTEEILDWIHSRGIENWVLARGGKTWPYHEHPRMVYRSWWLPLLLKRNQYQDTASHTKPFEFEALLGAQRPHRDFLWLYMNHHDLLNRSVVTYRTGFPGSLHDENTDQVYEQFGRKPQWPYVSPNLDPSWEPFAEVKNTVSFYIPWRIYQHTKYSVICETVSIENDFFFSEKVMKVLYGQRVFVHLGARGFLRHLHDLGFQTFGDIIDESYDDEPNNVLRWQRACEQLQVLASLDYQQVMATVCDRLQHNHDHLQAICNHHDQHQLLRQFIPSEILV